MSFDPDTFEKLTGRREPVVDVAGADPRFAAPVSSEKAQAIATARGIIRGGMNADLVNLARQFLRALGLPERE